MFLNSTFANQNRWNFQLAWRAMMIPALALAAGVGWTTCVAAQSASWIWPVGEQQEQIDTGSAYFRKTFTVNNPRQAILSITADDQYEVYINRQAAAVGDQLEPKLHNVSSLLRRGENTIAIQVTNTVGNTAGLLAELRVKEHRSEEWIVIPTDNTWRASSEAISIWAAPAFNDLRWKLAQTVAAPRDTVESLELDSGSSARDTTAEPEKRTSERGEIDSADSANHDSAAETEDIDSAGGLSESEPVEQPVASRIEVIPDIDSSSSAVQLVANTTGDEPGIQLDDQFEITKVVDGSYGSYIAMAFNEFGQTIISCEGDGLLLIDFTKEASNAARSRKLNDDVRNIQGILPLNGKLFVTGDGPEGVAIYRLEDNNRDGYFEKSVKILGFSGRLGEHGPHALRLGPDGMIYCIIGNANQVESAPSPSSPYHLPMEVELLPRYEDPGGHAVGVKAPGGTLVRMSLDGKKVELVAGGIRNAYDFAINDAGDIFVHDSDMEADAGLPWHRPTQLFHVVPGVDLGWRSGWAKWPAYYPDTINPLAQTGPGSPTGAVVYRHVMFPIRFHQSLFLGDWTNGRIFNVKLQADGASYRADVSTFFEAAGLTITDIAVGPDGALYFCTGGRGTEGGVYRIAWKGEIPDSFTRFNDDISRLVRFPQPTSAWAFQQRALLKKQMGDNWGEMLNGIVGEAGNRAIYRRQALRTMLFYGPMPSNQLLGRLANDSDAEIRRAAIEFLALTNHPQAAQILTRALEDNAATVQRAACETMVRRGISCDPRLLLPLMNSDDWALAAAARRQLENLPVDAWREMVFSTSSQKAFSQMAIALLRVEPSTENGLAVIDRFSEFAGGAISDANFIRLLRAVQYALVAPGMQDQALAEFKTLIAREFPSRHGKINHELARILARLRQGDLQGRIKDYLDQADDAVVDKLGVALALQTMAGELAAGDRLSLINYLEKHKNAEFAGGSYPYYLAQAIRDLAQHVTAGEIDTILQNGARWQYAALAVFYRQQEFTTAQIQQIIKVDEALANRQDEASIRLKLAIIAVLAQTGSPTTEASVGGDPASAAKLSVEYLRKIWRRDKHRMSDVVIGLCRQPAGDNWPYLVSSIGQVDDDATLEILTSLATVPRRPQPAEYYKAVLLAGFRLREKGAAPTCQILRSWTEEDIEVSDFRSASTAPGNGWREQLEAWRQLLEQKFPELAPIRLPEDTRSGNWSMSELLELIESDVNVADARRGKTVYMANCGNCHRFHGAGESMGPDLTNLTKRYSVREVMESILEPSKVVSDQYRGHEVLTTDGEQLLGIVSRTAQGNMVILKDDGTKLEIPSEQIEEVVEAKMSAMPAGLLDPLNHKDVLDLFAFLMRRTDDEAEAGQRAIR